MIKGITRKIKMIDLDVLVFMIFNFKNAVRKKFSMFFRQGIVFYKMHLRFKGLQQSENFLQPDEFFNPLLKRRELQSWILRKKFLGGSQITG